MKDIRKIRGILVFCGAFFLFVMVISLCPLRAEAANIRVKAQVKNLSSCKLTLKKSKQFTHWKIRMSRFTASGFSKYKTVKILKTSKKSVTIKNLKRDSYYGFEIVGCVKKNGKLKRVINDYTECFTGMSPAGWDEYAGSDAPCSPESITLWGYCYNDGLPVLGLELERREEGSEEWTKIAELKKAPYYYDDDKVEPGKTYYYRLRSFGTYKEKEMYSPYSGELCRSAVNRSGKYSCDVISRNKKKIILKLDSEKYNGKLIISAGSGLILAEDVTGVEEYDGTPVRIDAVSSDGEEWKTLGEDDYMEIGGGESLYIRLKRVRSDGDLSKGSVIGDSGLSYDGLPSWFVLTLGGSGETWMDAEMIH